jgi:hypothetical protein
VNYSRIDEADQLIEDALVALSQANYLLGIREGKMIVQDAHCTVVECRKLLHQQGIGPSGGVDCAVPAGTPPTMTALGLPALD